MYKPLKILVIRFSSIGDIILTTPIIRCLKNQFNTEVHFLTKKVFSCLLDNNPYIDKIYHKEQELKFLREESYDYIIDLQNNFYSKWISKFIKSKKIFRYYKFNFQKSLLINLGLNYLNEKHVVEKYFDTVSFIGVLNDEKGLDYFFSKEFVAKKVIRDSYLCWSLSASYKNKKLSKKQILGVCEKLDLAVVFIGGQKEYLEAEEIIKHTKNIKIYNFCGASLDESANILKNSKIVLTNDTGMMHIASSFNKPMISFWGCTKPILGFYPYKVTNSKMLISKPENRPCSKHGSRCRNNTRCITKISSQKILSTYAELIKECF